MALDERQHVALVLDSRTLDGRGLDVAASRGQVGGRGEALVVGKQEGQVERVGALVVGHRHECAPTPPPPVAVGPLTTASSGSGRRGR